MMKRQRGWLIGLTLVYIGAVAVGVMQWEPIEDYLTGWHRLGNGVAKARFAGITFGPEHRPGKVAHVRQAATVVENLPFAWIEVMDQLGPSADVWGTEDLSVTDRKGNHYEVTSPGAQYADAPEGNWRVTYVGIRFASSLPDPYDLTIRLRLRNQAATSEVLTFRTTGNGVQERPVS
jgi:hypothetical protein